MWMMGYNEGDFNLPDSFNGRKLRPLIPRGPLPLSSPNHNTATSATAAPPCLNRSRHGASHDFLAHCHQLAAMAEQSKRSEYMSTPQVVVSSRWNPTAEQLRALEELYSRGTRTPSAEQIQQITAQLRRYGKIEGKNVFYWFQNHKARERQKRRRQMESTAPSADDHNEQPLQMSMTSADHHDDHQNKEPLGSRRTSSVEVEETNTNNNNNNNYNWAAPSTNCSTSTNFAQESGAAAIEKAGKAAAAGGQGAGAAAECSRTDGWIQFEEEEMEQRRNFVERNATWQMMQLSCPLQSRHPPPPPAAAVVVAPSTHLINCTPHSTICTTAAQPTRSRRGARLDQRLIKSPTDRHLNFFLAPYNSSQTIFNTGPHHNNNNNNNTDDHRHRHGCVDESETLELFPLCSTGGADHANANADVSAHDPYPFFEFLPLKN